MSRGPVSVGLPAAAWGRLGPTGAHRRAALEGLLTWYLTRPAGPTWYAGRGRATPALTPRGAAP